MSAARARDASGGSGAVLACDLGGTRLRLAIVRPDGTLASRRALATPEGDPAVLKREMVALAKAYGDPLAGAVVGVPGPVDYFKGEALCLPNLPAWGKAPTAADLTAELGLPVLLANDADLAALGEHRYGAGRGCRDMLYITVSTGVGAGVIIGGRLLHGRQSLAEAGHMVLDLNTHATLEGLASGTALARSAGEEAPAVVDLAQRGDPVAKQHFLAAANALAVGIFNLVHCFSPERVVVGGGMARSGELLLAPVRDWLACCGRVCPAARADVVLAERGDDAGLVGARAYWEECLQHP